MTLPQAKMLLIAQCRQQQVPVPKGEALEALARKYVEAYEKLFPEESEDD